MPTRISAHTSCAGPIAAVVSGVAVESPSEPFSYCVSWAVADCTQSANQLVSFRKVLVVIACKTDNPDRDTRSLA